MSFNPVSRREARPPRWGFAEAKISRLSTAITIFLIAAVVVSSFLARVHFDALGFRIRIEQITPIILALWLLLHPQLRRPFVASLRHPVVLIFGALVAWNLVSTLLFSPDYRWSASILIWLTIDLFLLASLITLRAGGRLTFDIAVASTVPWAVAGIVAFLVANLTDGAIQFGVAFDWLYEIYVARVTAIEANIFASMLMLWGMLSITRVGIRWWWIAIQCVVVPLGLLASQTRTAIFSMTGGLIVFVIFVLLRRRTNFVENLKRTIPALSMIVSLLGLYGLVSLVPTDGTARPEFSAQVAETNIERSAAVETVTHATSQRTDTHASSESGAAAPTPSPEPTKYVPDPANPDTQNKLGDFRLDGGTIGFRITVAEIAAQDMQGVNLWFGNGTNTFGLRHDQPDSPGTTGHIIMLPVQILYDGGVVGLLLLVSLFATVFIYTPRERKPITAGVLSSVLVSATLTSFFWFSMTWILFATLLRPADGDRGWLHSVGRFRVFKSEKDT